MIVVIAIKFIAITIITMIIVIIIIIIIIRVTLAAMSLGIARRCVEDMNRYARERQAVESIYR